MNRLLKPAPAPISRRVFAAFGLAILIGAAVFAIWWTTAPRRLEAPGVVSQPPTAKPQPDARADPPVPPAAAPPNVEEALSLPRGGRLTGTPGELGEDMQSLTQAPLVRINRSSDEVEPWLAESWKGSPDNLTYTLKLRSGLAWSDGRPLAIEDVVAAFEKPPAPFQPVGTLWPIVPAGIPPFSVRALDSSTVEVRFSRPFAPGLRVLDAYPILPRHAPSNRAGLGPFVAPAPRDLLVFARNPHYWRAAPAGERLPYLDEVRLYQPIDPPVDYASLDFSNGAVLPEEYEQVRKLERDEKLRLFHLGAGLDADVVLFALPPVTPSPPDSDRPDNVKPWFYTEAFRRAISTAIDRREYCKQVYFGACDPASGPVSPANTAWFDPDLPLVTANAQVARTMLADLGLRDRTGDGVLDDAMRRTVRFSMLFVRGEYFERRAAFVANALRAVGVQVSITPVDSPALRARLKTKDYEAVYGRLEVRDTDPAMNLGFWMTPEPAAGWQRQINELMIRNASSFDRVARLQAFVEAQRIYSKYLPAIFLGVPHVRVYTGTRVLNARPSPLRPHVLWNADSLAVLK
jgi:peptide/nickel transport system substrate-binding protein